MKLAGWKVEGRLPPNTERAVLIAAPHTSNWDLPYTLMVCFILGMDGFWLGKDTIFKAPFGSVMRWLGGIPVDRTKSNNLVADVAERLRTSKQPMHLLIPPEGSRSKVRYWKTGFYYIAAAAQVPILMAFMDYPQKRAGLGSVFTPTGDIDKDMVAIKAFYAQFTGKFADKFEA
jgi:1-acyl-sn-glycerol-3-phosphate acyltransferase